MEQLAIGGVNSPASLPGDTSTQSPAHSSPEQSDRELVRYLRLRDGDLPARVPSHAPRGRCKYARHYPNGGCPWCREKATSTS